MIFTPYTSVVVMSNPGTDVFTTTTCVAHSLLDPTVTCTTTVYVTCTLYKVNTGYGCLCL